MFYCVHMVMFDLVDSLYASLSGAVLSRGSEWSLSWDIGSAGSFFFFLLISISGPFSLCMDSPCHPEWWPLYSDSQTSYTEAQHLKK